MWSTVRLGVRAGPPTRTKGRVYIRESLRAKYGEQFIVVPGPRDLRLVPVPEDPVADLRELGKPLRGVPLRRIKKAIEEEARRQGVA